MLPTFYRRSRLHPEALAAITYRLKLLNGDTVVTESDLDLDELEKSIKNQTERRSGWIHVGDVIIHSAQLVYVQPYDGPDENDNQESAA